MKIMTITSNYNHKSNVKNQQPAFGIAKINLKDKNLMWSTAAKYGYKEKYVEPFKKIFTKLQEIPSLKKALKEAPDNVEIDAQVTNFSPGAFYVGVSKAGSNSYDARYIIAPTGLEVRSYKIQGTTDNSLELIGNKMARDVEHITRA